MTMRLASVERDYYLLQEGLRLEVGNLISWMIFKMSTISHFR